MTTFSPSYRGEQPSFKHITLYQLCYWKVTCIYGLTQEEIETLITNPDSQTPSHHQVDPRIIKAYLTGESVHLPGHLLPCYFGIFPTYLPRDRFHPSERAVFLVDAHYRQDYHIWKLRLDANTRATQSSHRSSSEYSFCPYCQSCRTQVVEWISQHISQLQ
jgi:hypothetical protein